MKKLNVLFLSLVALGATVVSCSKDEAPAAPKTEGKWLFQTVSATPDGGAKGEAQPYSDPACTGKSSYLDIKTGGNLEIGEVNASDATEGTPCDIITSAATWKNESNTLKITIEGNVIELPIVSMTNEQLVLKRVVTGGYYEFILKRS